MTDIRPFTQYSFKVRAYTEGDESPFSEVVTIITEERGTFFHANTVFKCMCCEWIHHIFNLLILIKF